MQQDPYSERFVLCTDRVVLECRCGESLILLGREEDWYLEGRTTFECGECRRSLTLVDRFDEDRGAALVGSSRDEEAMSITDLIRSLRTAEGQ